MWPPGDPDTPPSSPSAFDDEFASGTLDPAWAAFGTVDILNTTAKNHHLYMKRTGVGANALCGILKVAPAMPFTVTCKVADAWVVSGNGGYGLVLANAAADRFYSGPWPVYASGYGGWNDIFRSWWTSTTARGASADSDARTYPGGGSRLYQYLRLIVTSSTNFALAVSVDGNFFHTFVTGETTATSGSWTINKVGLCIGHVNAATAAEAFFDWIRFT